MVMFGKMSTMRRFFYYLWNFWPPFVGAGITVNYVSDDLLYAKMRLKRRPWTKNLVGVHFGGSIFAMTDPMYMALLINKLGPDYIVWDKSSFIRYRKPGRTDLWAEFRITLDDIEEIKSRLQSCDKIDWQRDVLVKDDLGETVAEVRKVIHVRRSLRSKRE
jgi:hypothetical protein